MCTIGRFSFTFPRTWGYRFFRRAALFVLSLSLPRTRSLQRGTPKIMAQIKISADLQTGGRECAQNKLIRQWLCVLKPDSGGAAAAATTSSLIRARSRNIGARMPNCSCRHRSPRNLSNFSNLVSARSQTGSHAAAGRPLHHGLSDDAPTPLVFLVFREQSACVIYTTHYVGR